MFGNTNNRKQTDNDKFDIFLPVDLAGYLKQAFRNYHKIKYFVEISRISVSITEL